MQQKIMPVRGSLPDFERPPIIEALLGVEFAPLKGWSIPHYGMFWERIRSDYPKQAVQPPMATVLERQKSGSGPFFEVVTGTPSVRCWFVDEPETRLVQVQDTRFLHNWRKVSGMEQYPRYGDSIRPIFEEEWKRFVNFLTNERIDSPNVLECEITYVNHFEREREWTDHADLGRIFSFWRPEREQGFLPPPQLGRLQVAYPIAENQGTLFVRLEPGFRNRDARCLGNLILESLVHNLLYRLSVGKEETEITTEYVFLSRNQQAVCI